MRGAADGIAIGGLESFKVARTAEETAALLCQLHALEDRSAISIELACRSAELEIVCSGRRAADELCKSRPGLWNVEAYEKEWGSNPDYNDFMSADSPVFHKKSFQSEIYFSMLSKYTCALGSGSAILDAGAGVGRMAPHLAPLGARLELFDSSELALKVAWRTLCECGADNFDIHRGDAQDLSIFGNGTFDFCLALELLCYLDYPDKAATELARVCKPGGIVAFSVENKAGAILGDANLSFEEISSLAETDTLCVPGYGFTRYYTRESARALAEDAGLRVVEVTGCHFVADGPFNASATEGALADPLKRARAREIERICREDSIIGKLGRAWLVVAEKR